MKNFGLFAAALAAFALLSINSNAQPRNHQNWQDKMMSEKIAFITSELDLSPSEAQVFWPVYNQIAKEQQASQKAVKEAYIALMKALEDENTSDKDIDKLLDKYLAVKEANKGNGKAEADRYRRVLPSKNVVKLYVAEEKFRRMHIRNLSGPRPQGAPGRPQEGQGKPQGNRPEPRK